MVEDLRKNEITAHRAGQLFNSKITKEFWASFKGEVGRVQAEVLVFLHDFPDSNLTEIVEELNVPKQHVSKIVIDFVDEGLIESRKNTKDKRSNTLRLTHKGEEYIQKHLEISYEHFISLMNDMDETDRKEFIQALETINRILSR